MQTMPPMRSLADHPNYGITEDGRIWSYERISPVRLIRYPGRWLKLSRNKVSGYLYCSFSVPKRITIKGKNVANKIMAVHVLVAKAWVDNPNNYRVVNHLDGNKQNNDATNLEWCTQDQNRTHAIDNGFDKLHLTKQQKIDIINQWWEDPYYRKRYPWTRVTFYRIMKRYHIRKRKIPLHRKQFYIDVYQLVEYLKKDRDNALVNRRPFKANQKLLKQQFADKHNISLSTVYVLISRIKYGRQI